MRYQALANAIIVELNKLIADQTKENAYICAYHLVTLRSIAAAQENRDVCGGMPMLEGGDLAHRITDYFTDDDSLAKFYEYIKSHIIPNWGIILENPEVARPKRFVQGVLPNTLVTLSIEERVGQLIADLTALLKNLQGRELAALPTEVKYHVLCQIMWLGEAFDQLKKNAGKMDIRQALFQADAREAVLPAALIKARHAICHPRITDRHHKSADVLDLTFQEVTDLLPDITKSSNRAVEMMSQWIASRKDLFRLINTELTRTLDVLEGEKEHQAELENDAAQAAEINQKIRKLTATNNMLVRVYTQINHGVEAIDDINIRLPNEAAAAARPPNEVLTESPVVRGLAQEARQLDALNTLKKARMALAQMEEIFHSNIQNISDILLESNDYSALLVVLGVILEHIPVDYKNYDTDPRNDQSVIFKRKLHPLGEAIATCSDAAYLAKLIALLKERKRTALPKIDLLLLKDEKKYLKITTWGDYIIAWYFLAHEYRTSESGGTITREAFHKQIGLADFGFDNFLGLFKLILQQTEDPKKLFTRLGILTLLEHINDGGNAFWKILKEELPKFKPLKAQGMADSEGVSLLLRNFSRELFEILMAEHCNLNHYFEKLLSSKMHVQASEVNPTKNELKITRTFHLTFDAERFKASLDLVPAEKLAEISQSLLPQLVYLCLYYDDPIYMEKLQVLLSYPAVVTTGSMPNANPLHPNKQVFEFRNVKKIPISLLLLTLNIMDNPVKWRQLNIVVTTISESSSDGDRLIDCFNTKTPALTTKETAPISKVTVLEGVNTFYGPNGIYGQQDEIVEFYQHIFATAEARESPGRIKSKIAKIDKEIKELEIAIGKLKKSKRKKSAGLFDSGPNQNLLDKKAEKAKLEERLAAQETPDAGKVPAAAAAAGLS